MRASSSRRRSILMQLARSNDKRFGRRAWQELSVQRPECSFQKPRLPELCCRARGCFFEVGISSLPGSDSRDSCPHGRPLWNPRAAASFQRRSGSGAPESLPTMRAAIQTIPSPCPLPTGALMNNSTTGTRTRVARVRAEYPNQLDYSGFCFCTVVFHTNARSGPACLAGLPPEGIRSTTYNSSCARSHADLMRLMLMIQTTRCDAPNSGIR